MAWMSATALVNLIQIRDLAQSGATRQLRLALGLSLPELAQQVGVSPSTVYRWEVGERTPHGAAALRYRATLKRLVRDSLPELQEAGR